MWAFKIFALILQGGNDYTVLIGYCCLEMICFLSWNLYCYIMFCFSYLAKYVKEYIEGAKPLFSVGEYWDSCNYNGYGLDYNQGNGLDLFFIFEIIHKKILNSFSSIKLLIYL